VVARPRTAAQRRRVGFNVADAGQRTGCREVFAIVNQSLRQLAVIGADRVFAGARYQLFDSDVAADYNEAAVFAGFNYTFR